MAKVVIGKFFFSVAMYSKLIKVFTISIIRTSRNKKTMKNVVIPLVDGRTEEGFGLVNSMP